MASGVLREDSFFQTANGLNIKILRGTKWFGHASSPTIRFDGRDDIELFAVQTKSGRYIWHIRVFDQVQQLNYSLDYPRSYFKQTL